jgi:amidohydrolase
LVVIDEIRQFVPELVAIRHDIHAHPELAYQEQRTSELVATLLTSFGCEVHRGLGKTGVVGRLTHGASSRTLGLRADMDALPLTETNHFPHRSRHDGRMHACGHDGHTTMLLGAALYLAATRAFDGTVNFIFQPAEEGEGGAPAMIKDGLFELFPCDNVFAMHNMPGLAVGKFATRPGAASAGVAMFEIAVAGIGGHGAIPESAIDPVVTAAHIAMALQTIVARNIRPFEPAVVSVTQIHAGDAFNVIPSSAVLRGTARAFSPETLRLIGANVERIAANIAAGFGATASTSFRIINPPMINDAAQTTFVADVAAALVGEENVARDCAPIMAGDDFAFMLEARSGAFLYIGNGDGEGSCEVHNPNYDFNDEILPLGASLWAKLVETRLAKA